LFRHKVVFARHCEGEARSNPVKSILWIASPDGSQ